MGLVAEPIVVPIIVFKDAALGGTLANLRPESATTSCAFVSGYFGFNDALEAACNGRGIVYTVEDSRGLDTFSLFAVPTTGAGDDVVRVPIAVSKFVVKVFMAIVATLLEYLFLWLCVPATTVIPVAITMETLRATEDGIFFDTPVTTRL